MTSATATPPSAPTPAWLPPRLLLDDDPPPLKPIQRPAPPSAPAAAPAEGRVEPRVNLASVRRLRELGGVVIGEETSVWRWAADSHPLPREMPGERGWG